AEDHPEDAGLPGAEVFPAVRQPPIEQGAVAGVERRALAVVVQSDLAVHHVEELDLAGLDKDLLGLDALGPRIERGHDRADLALEEPGAEHGPLLRRAVEGHHGVVLLARHLDAAGRLAVEERGDRHAERTGDLAERVERAREPAGLDLRDHAGRQLGLLGELPLLQVALQPQRLDARAQRGHATSMDGPWSSPASRARARATKTRATFLR